MLKGRDYRPIRSHPPGRAAIRNLRYILLKTLLICCARLPLRWVHALGNAVGYVIYRFPTPLKHATLRNLRTCFPDMNHQEINRLAKRSLQHTAKTALEMGKAWLLPLPETLSLVKETEGSELLEQAMADGKGVILLAPHFGNWEMFGFHITKGIASTFLYQPPQSPKLDKLIQQARSRGGASVVPTTRKGVAALRRALRDGELIGILPDQAPGRNEGGVFAPFFGVRAPTMTLAGKLAGKTGARVLIGYAHRLPQSGGFRVVIRDADAAIYDERPEVSASALNRSVQRLVEGAGPGGVEQYQWEYKRFRRLQDGTNLYRQ
ncbi:MAG: lysophospholipid acyltransferase family protein [Pseudohongiellaceae bacterium]